MLCWRVNYPLLVGGRVDKQMGMNWLLYLVLINGLTFFLYWHDKRSSQMHGARRVPEATLLGLGFLGGTPAALVAQRLLRHKTRKTSFQLKFWAITFVQLALLALQPDPVGQILYRAFA